jgi:hypothetical protein
MSVTSVWKFCKPLIVIFVFVFVLLARLVSLSVFNSSLQNALLNPSAFLCQQSDACELTLGSDI